MSGNFSFPALLFSFIAPFLPLTAHAAGDQWADFATVSMTNPTTPRLSANRLCYTDGVDLACDGAAGLLLTSGTLSIRNISASTLTVAGTISSTSGIQVGPLTATCASGISGTIRYNTSSNTMEYCNGSAWANLGPSATTPVSFLVNKGGTGQTITANTWTQLTWSNEVYDTNNNFASNRFTPMVPGKYLLSPNALCSGTGDCYVAIYKNGVVFSMNGVSSGAPGGPRIGNSVIVDMNGTTDYVEAYVWSANTTIGGAIESTYFSGVLIGPQAGGGGGTATPAGSTADVQYNSGGALAADTGLFTYSSGVLKAPTVSATTQNGYYASFTTVNAGGIGAGLINATGISVTTNQASFTTVYASGRVGIGTSVPQFSLDITRTFGISPITNYYTDISHNLYWNGSSWASRNGGPGSLLRLWGGANGDGEIEFNVTSAARNTPSATAVSMIQAMYINKSGKVGIGTSSPDELLHVDAASGDVNIKVGPSSGNSNAGIKFYGTTGGTAYGPAYVYSDWGGNLVLSGGPSAGLMMVVNATSASMAISSAGNVGIGTTSPNALLDVNGTISSTRLNTRGISTTTNQTSVTTLYASGRVGIGTTSPPDSNLLAVRNAGGNALSLAVPANNTAIQTYNLTGSGSYFAASFTSGATCCTTVGSIQVGTASTAYNTTSDRRLKENIDPTKTGLDTLLQMEVKDFNFKSEPGVRQQGFIAQELYKVYPQAVTVGGDDPKTNPWAVDYGRLTPLLVKAVQDLKAENDELRGLLEQQRRAFEAFKSTHP